MSRPTILYLFDTIHFHIIHAVSYKTFEGTYFVLLHQAIAQEYNILVRKYNYIAMEYENYPREKCPYNVYQ